MNTMRRKRERRSDSQPTDESSIGPEQRSDAQVLITADGRSTLDGTPLRPDEGESLEDAVLNTLHRRAIERNAPVEAAVHDGREGSTTRIEVAPDGSSRLLEHIPLPAVRPAPRHAVNPPPDTSSPPPAPGPAPAPAPEPPAAPIGPSHAEPVSADPANGRPPRRTASIPDELLQPVARVNEAVANGRLDFAASLVSHLVARTSQAHGAEHEYVLNLLELRSYVSHLRGDHQFAAATCLHLARIRLQQGDPRVHQDLVRAASSWWLMEDPVAAVETGRHLVEVWTRTEAALGPATGAGPGPEPARRHLDDLLAQVTGPGASDTSHAGLAHVPS
ncbi:hypothetical protein [Wenjunlia tyrosinilytica]|uniref:Uncharacterized protein n=1 Tax=Wenjunlia tyrosinilytica TaxID=1544741 RepID=A0A917ZUA9_9ACTN|nr:hypothetical protein [Wenjunlia tyrosinilytica]GGO95739.1 hypothetical protein GCM10012280_53630 [Wenjunlia tyrosinilytica]